MSNELNVRRLPKFASARSVPNEVRAAIGKLEADPGGSTGRKNNIRLPDNRVMAHVANNTIGNIQDARNLFQVLPDMDYARQLLISAVISPGDLTSTNVVYSVTDDSLDSSLTGPLLRNCQEFFDNSYRIRSLLHPILSDTMFEKGSYPILIMPESSIDAIINSDNYNGISMESAVSALDGHIRSETDNNGNYLPWGILGNPAAASSDVDSYTGVSFESRKPNDYVSSVNTSNISLSMESFVARIDKTEENMPIRTGLENLGKSINNMLQKKPSTINVTDNVSILKRPMVVETRRRLAVRRIYGGRLHSTASLESRANNGDRDAMRSLKSIEKSLYTRRNYKHIPVQPIRTKDQLNVETYGHPLVLHLPPESVIPVHVPGNPSEHVGYYVILDIDGNPISVADMTTYMDDIRNQMNSADAYSSQIIQQARRGFEGMGGIQNEIINEMARIHSEAVENDLLARLRAGVLSGNYELGKTENVNRIMLARHLKGQKTTMLFVPSELMVYIAFDYNEYGVGKSMIEDGKILGSIRTALMLANTLATINNAVGGKTINIELDPEDETPVETVEFLLSEHAKVNSQGFTRMVGSTHPLGIADQIQNHGVNVQVSGNTRYPETKFDVQSRDGTSRVVDTEYEKAMRDRHIQMFGISPEAMDGMNQTDFATTVVQNNLMLLKRVLLTQEKFDPFLTDFTRRYMLNSGIFLSEMRSIIKENADHLPEDIRKDASLSLADKVDEFLYRFVGSVSVTLPSPEIGDIKKSMEQFDAYTEALDKAIDVYISEEMFATDTTIGMEELIPNIKVVIRSEFQRRWLRKYNVLPELDIFNTVDESTGDTPAFNLLEMTADHLDGLNKSIADYAHKVIEAAKKRTDLLKRVNEAKADLTTAKDDAGGAAEGGGMDDGFGGDSNDPVDDDMPADDLPEEEELPEDEPLDEEESTEEEEEEVEQEEPTPEEEAGNPEEELPNS